MEIQISDRVEKTLWEKEKLLVTSNLFLFPQVFKSCLFIMHQNEYLWSKGLKQCCDCKKYEAAHHHNSHPSPNNQLKKKKRSIISCFPVQYREISVKIIFDLTLLPPVKMLIFMFLLPRLIARTSQPDGNMMSFILHFLRTT